MYSSKGFQQHSDKLRLEHLFLHQVIKKRYSFSPFSSSSMNGVSKISFLVFIL
jgi:hypothetical protein